MNDPRSEVLDGLVFQYLERVDAGETGAAVLQELCSGHPDEAEALRRGVRLLRESRLHPGPAEDGLPERVGPFRLLRRLGAGGMGVVYLAEQANPTRQVALKLVRPDQLWFEGYRERFAREIESAGRLAHPGIAPVYEMGEHDGVPWFTQEYIVGASLSAILSNVPARSPETLRGSDLRAALEDALEEDAPASPWDEEFFLGTWVDVCVRIGRQVANALQHAHERGVLHRDVKPGNILLTPGGRAVLVDFGLASLQGTERITRTGAQLGSLHYMPPEQIEGRAEVGPRSDVYSLAVTIYELLTLRAPYSSQSIQRLCGMILEGDAPELRRLNRAISRDVHVVVHCAMQPVASRRYETAGELASDLTAVQNHRPIMAQPTGPARRLARWVRRRPAAAVTAVAGFLLLVVAPIVFGIQSMRAASEQQSLNSELEEALATSDALLGATLQGFENVVRWTAHGALADVPGFQEERLVVIDEGLATFDRIVAARPEDFEVRLQQALMRRTRANILTNLGRNSEAKAQYEQAAEVFAQALDLRIDEARWSRELASLRYQQARNETAQGRHEQAIAANREAVDHQRRAAELDPEDARNARDLCALASSLAGDLYRRDGLSQEAIALMEESVAAGRRAVQMTPGDPRVHRSLYESVGTRGNWHRTGGRLQEALVDLNEARASLERALQLDPNNRVLRQQYVHMLYLCADLGLAVTHDGESAVPRLEQALDLNDALIADYPALPELEKQRVQILTSLARAFRQKGDTEGGLAINEELVETVVAQAMSDPGNRQTSMDAAVVMVNLCNALGLDESQDEDGYRRILDLCEEAEELAAPYAEINRGSQYERRFRMGLHFRRGMTWFRLGNAEKVWESIEALSTLQLDLPLKLYGTGVLCFNWYELTGEASGRDRAIAEIERAVEAGFEDLSAWEASDFEADYPDLVRIRELGAIIRQRAASQ